METVIYLPILYTLGVLNIIVNFSCLILLYINNLRYENLESMAMVRLFPPFCCCSTQEHPEYKKSGVFLCENDKEFSCENDTGEEISTEKENNIEEKTNEDKELDEVFNYYFKRESGVDEKKHSQRGPIPFNKTSGGYISNKEMDEKDEENYTDEEKKKIIDSFSFLIGKEYSDAVKLASYNGYKLLPKSNSISDSMFYSYKGDTLLVETYKNCTDDQFTKRIIDIGIISVF